MFPKPKRRRQREVQAGSMADIAFLLLIFFLVTTTIVQEKGLPVRLPAYLPTPVTSLPDRNVLSVKLNAADELLVEQERLRPAVLAQRVKTFIQNPRQLPTLPGSPRSAVIALQHDRGTSYAAYLEVYNELLSAYHEIWEEEARLEYGRAYDQLSKAQRKAIRQAYPLIISESEPVAY